MQFSRYLQVFSLGLLGLVPAVHADTIYTLDQGGSCCGTGTFATVTLHVVDADTVQITEILTSGDIFAFTGAGDPLQFNVDEPFSLVAGSLTSGFVLSLAPDSASPFGNFLSSIQCANPCAYGNGTSAPQFLGPLSFELTNAAGLSPSDFVSNSGGYFFATDIGIPVAGGGFTTGNVAATGANSQSPPPTAPEPSTVIFLASGGVILFLLRKRLTT